MNKNVKYSVIFVPVLLVITTYLMSFYALDGMVGHDFSHFLPRLNSTYLYMMNNGLAVEYYTPWFGGGLPAYANPQHMQFSLPQLLTFFMNSWHAVLVSTAIILVVGWFFALQFLHKVLKFSIELASIGAILMVATGFHLEHLLVGHLGYLNWPLLYGILWIAFDFERFSRRQQLMYVALIMAIQLYSGGFYSLVIFTFSIGMTLPFILHRHKETLDKGLRILVQSLPVVLLFSISKIIATVSWMSNFPRHMIEANDASLWSSISGLFGVLFIMPIKTISKNYLSGEITMDSWMDRTWEKGVWEFDIGISPILLILIVGVLIYYGYRWRQSLLLCKKNNWKEGWYAYLICGLSFVVVFSLWHAQGGVYQLLKQLPILSSFSVNARFNAAYIVPLAIVGLVALEKVPSITRWLPLVGIVIALIFMRYSDLPKAMNHDNMVYNYPIANASETYDLIREHQGRLRVNYILPVADANSFLFSSSSAYPYEPLFGYDLSLFKTPLKITPLSEDKAVRIAVETLEDEQYNILDPRAFLKGWSDKPLFARISLDDSVQMEQFVQHKKIDWTLPFKQRVANLISFISCMGAMVLLLPLPIWRKHD